MAVAASKCLPALPAAAAPQRRARYYLLRCRCSEEDTLLPGIPLSREKQRLVFPANSIKAPPLRPRRIVLVRHGESEGNVDESAYTRVPDPRIGLTAKGRRDAELCGRRLRDLFASDGDDWKVYFYVSPYRRGLETLRGIGHAFEAHRIAGVREEPRIREQDFGEQISLLLEDKEGALSSVHCILHAVNGL
jgi:phosphohistidine phosphatase SixA